jgi:adenosylcobyric acid synthase
LIAGFIVNKMRGDPSLFANGMHFVAERTGWAAVGLVPHFADAHRLPAEDVLGLESFRALDAERGGRRVRIAVPVLPHISNFDDLDPLRLEPGVEVILLRNGAPLPVDTDLVILPGSKATIADLAALRGFGWDSDIIAHARRGGRVLGLCGGYQMLGRSVSDPEGIEGPPGSVDGIGLLDITTELAGDKSLVAINGRTISDDITVSGYEMHIGRTTGPATQNPMVKFEDGRVDGAVSANGRIAGTYLHGFFGGDEQRTAWLARLGSPASSLAYEELIDQTLDALAAHFEAHLDVEKLLSLAR